MVLENIKNIPSQNIGSVGKYSSLNVSHFVSFLFSALQCVESKGEYFVKTFTIYFNLPAAWIYLIYYIIYPVEFFSVRCQVKIKRKAAK